MGESWPGLRVTCDRAAREDCPQYRLGSDQELRLLASVQNSRLKASSPHPKYKKGLVATDPGLAALVWLHFILQGLPHSGLGRLRDVGHLHLQNRSYSSPRSCPSCFSREGPSWEPSWVDPGGIREGDAC